MPDLADLNLGNAQGAPSATKHAQDTSSREEQQSQKAPRGADTTNSATASTTSDRIPPTNGETQPDKATRHTITEEAKRNANFRSSIKDGEEFLFMLHSSALE